MREIIRRKGGELPLSDIRRACGKCHEQAEYFGYSGDRVKGLIFCSRIDEAKELSKKFNAKGWRTLVLGGSYEDGYDDAYDYWEEEMDYKI